MLGTLVNGRYRLDAELGRGGMGVIYRACDTLLERDVAAKIITATRNRELHPRLLREARAAARLNHPNIVSIFDAGEAIFASDTESTPFIVMELVQGKSLFERPPESLKEIAIIASQICAALVHAHEHDIVHRDLKPENVLLTPDGTTKLTDFGMARLSSSHTSEEGKIAGTIFYLAPEVAQGKEVDGRADLYALGVMLYEWTTGKLPFRSDDPLAVIAQHIHEAPVPPRKLNPRISPWLNDLILELLHKFPEDRPASASEVYQRLEHFERETRIAELPSETPTLLTTKLHIPSSRPGIVPRQRLTSQLEDGLDCKFTIVSAPAGFGKTTLVAEWVAANERSVAWVSLDKGDNDENLFWTYVVFALKRVEENIGGRALATLQPSQSPSTEQFLIDLINEMNLIQLNPLVLILDDFHWITNRAIHEGMMLILDNLPSHVHLIISSRVDPPWPLARLRARGEMSELRAKDLRFTFNEVVTFLNELLEFSLSAEDVAALNSRIEGWIAGLQMAAISLQRRNDVSEFIRSFTGSNRFVLDFLVEEVLSQQSPDIQDFLHKTSIVERMCASLCEALTGQKGPQRILTRLDQENLFVVPLDDQRRWYRYHHLFSDLLRSRLSQIQPELIPELHHNASKWYEEHGLTSEAMHHALQMEDIEIVADLVERNALMLAYHGEVKTLLGWLDMMPEGRVRSRPLLCLARAWALGFAGQLDEVEPWIQKAESAVEKYSAESDLIEQIGAQTISGYVNIVRAYAAIYQEDNARASKLSREALNRLPDEDRVASGLAAMMLAVSYRLSGDFNAATHAFAEATSICMNAGDVYLAVDLLWERAVFEFSNGQLHKVVDTCQIAHRMADEYVRENGRQIPIMGYIHERMSKVYLEWNDLENALRFATRGVELSKQWGQADALIECYFGLAKTLMATGDLKEAMEIVQKTRLFASDLGPWYILMSHGLEAQIQLQRGNIAAATRWMYENESLISGELQFMYGSIYLIIGRILIANDEIDKALSLLGRLMDQEKYTGAKGLEIQILILQALAFQANGEEQKAVHSIEQALFLAEPEGYVYSFIRNATPMVSLLRKVLARGKCVEYVGALLMALEGEKGILWRSAEPSIMDMVDPLSERELQILRLLATNLSVPEIAEELIIAVSTVRSHVKNIYSKLEVHSRLEAVTQAREMNLI